MRWRDALIVALLASSLLGCAGSSPTRRAVDAEAKDAADLQVRLGRGYMDRGELEIALDRLQQALKLDPNSVDAYTLMAVLHERIKRPEQAETYYRKAVELAPENGEVNNNLGAFLCGKAQYQDAIARFLKALDDPFYKSPASALANAGVCAVKAKDLTGAEDYFRRVLQIEPTHAVALFELARLSYLAHQDMRARAFLQRLEAVNTAGPIMLDLGQRIENRIGDAAAAKRYSERLHTEFPDYVPDSSLDPSEQP
jgi:type IV pilus assembly protein PilF